MKVTKKHTRIETYSCDTFSKEIWIAISVFSAATIYETHRFTVEYLA